MDNVCVCCGVIIPEGRQVCTSCETIAIQNLQRLRESKVAQVIELPCRIGDTLYLVFPKRWSVDDEWRWRIQKSRLTYGNMERVCREFGKYYFPTRMEAEQRLKELQTQQEKNK